MKINRRRLLTGSAAVTSVACAPAIVRAQEKPTKIRIGLVRLISSGPIFIAETRKFFEKVNLDAELTYFADGALAMPALVAGELDLTATTLNAGLFNTVSKGAPFKLILDRGSEKPGHGSMTIVASNANSMTTRSTKPTGANTNAVPFSFASLQAAVPAAFAQVQDPIIVPGCSRARRAGDSAPARVRTFTWRCFLPVPSSRPAGSGSSTAR